MREFLFGKKASAILEYGLLITIIIAALIAMQVYVKRAISGKYKEAADIFGFGRQYEPGVTETNETNMTLITTYRN